MASSSLVETFTKFSNSLKAIKEKLLDGGEYTNVLSDLGGFWTHIDACMIHVSQEITKLSLACSQPPFPKSEELLTVLTSIENVAINLASACLNLSGAVYGATLKMSLTSTVEDLLDKIIELLNNLSESCSEKRNKYLQTTGTIWNAADKFKSLPKNNKDAVLPGLRTILDLIEDAITEFDAEIKKSTDDGLGKGCDTIDELEFENFAEKWPKLQLGMVTSAFGIFKTSKVCVAKVIKAVETNGTTSVTEKSEVSPLSDSISELMTRLTLDDDSDDSDDSPSKSDTFLQDCSDYSNPASQLDIVSHLVFKLSPAIDDLALYLYPPLMEVESAKYNVQVISQLLTDLMEVTRSSHFVVSTDTKWLDFLGSAIKHNTDKTLKAIEEYCETVDGGCIKTFIESNSLL